MILNNLNSAPKLTFCLFELGSYIPRKKDKQMKKLILSIITGIMFVGCNDSENPDPGELKFIVTVSPAPEDTKFMLGSEMYFVLNMSGSQTSFVSDPVLIDPRENYQYQIANLESTEECHQVTVEAFYRNKSFHKKNFEMYGIHNLYSSLEDQCGSATIKWTNKLAR
ncbi:hypothetical protein P872_14500 [Rhodonellum psychrophilum GCM71 = DSM 17998]|uniref:Lipoprotein n=2 Tax=Cytophagaceae TaxID=89373 RepID=U5BW25_9BACT|nr:hypothetical protein P872_14500 [Rhodonellum psychrophilum GCM71 = DSM 17998]